MLYQTQFFLCLNTWSLHPNGFSDGGQALPADEKELECAQICVSLWNEAGTIPWYIRYCIEVLRNELRAEHIHRVIRGSNLKWRYPTRSNITIIEPDQILDCVVNGKWNILSLRSSGFLLLNEETIHKKFLEAM